MKHAMWFAAVAALIASSVLKTTRADAATLSYANNWNYVVPAGVTLSGSNYFASTTDLANTGRATLAGTVWSGGTSGAFGSSPAQLNNGLYAPAELSGGVPNGSVNAQGTDTTLLATPNTTYTINFTSGMDISSLIVYSAMTGTNRAKQNWSLEYSPVGSGSYTSTGVTIAQSTNGNRQGAWYNTVTLTSGSSELRNVGSLRFTFLTPVYNAATDGSNSTFLDTGYREIDVFGTAVGLIWDNAAGTAIWSDASANWTNGGASQAWTNGSAAVFGATGAGAVTVSGTNNVNSLTVSAAGYSFSGGQINLGQASTTLEINHAASIASVIGGANGLVKTGTATLTLSGSNSYSGATTVNAGQISLGNANALGDSAGTLAVYAGTLDLGGNSLTKAALSGSASGIITSTSSATLTVNQSTSTTYGGRVGGAVGLTKTGAGGLTLSGSNDHTGTTAVSGGGTLAVTNAFALGATGTASGTVISGVGTALTLQGNIDVGESITLLANNGDNINMLRSLSGANTLSGPVTLSGSNRAGIRATAGDFTVSGGITRDASQNLLLANDGSGLLTVSANPIALGSGVLEVNGPGVTVLNVAGNTLGQLNVRWTGNMRTDVANAWSPTTLLVVGSEGMTSGTNRLDLNGNSQTVGRLSGDAAGTKVNIITSASAATLTVNQGVASTYSGLLSGAVGLVKTGSGALTLGGANDYSGATAVNDGTLLVNGNQSAAAGAVTVASAAILGGSGQIGGAVTVDGTLSPGTSPGVLSMPSLALGASSTTLMEITGLTRSTQYDGLDLTGSLTYGGTLSLNIAQVFGDNTTFNLFSGFTSETGDFTSVVSTGSAYNGLAFTRTGNLWTSGNSGTQWIEFDQTTGNLAVVPEPAGIAMAGFAIAICGWSMRKRRRA
jgi:fibronectin-binding autotransporter adhesin